MRTARELGAELWGDLRQADTYFNVRNGRLKLRETPGFQAELIFYERDEDAPRRESRYEEVALPDAGGLREMLVAALGVRGVVRKRRTLLLMDTTRIHLDNVDGLGAFLEIEVPVRDEDVAAAQAQLESLMQALGYGWSDCIRASYIDLLGAESGAEG
jgi:predicted adenylyl cyclase CyaB